MQKEISTTVKSDKYMFVLILKILAVAAFCFLIAPMVMIAVKGMIGVVLCVVIGLVSINFIPRLIDMLANWNLKALKFEASHNPIETLETDYMKKLEALSTFRDSINNFSASTKTFQDKLAKFKTTYPGEAEKFEDQLDKMKSLLSLRRKKYAEAEKSVEDYALEIEKAKAIWSMALAAAEMNKASGMNEKDVLQKIKVETSLDSITETMNSAFAELETSLIEESDEGQVAGAKK